MSKIETEWFKDWFNSPYYHILYKNRNEAEAAAFLDALTQCLKLPKGAKVLDLPCGKGRHSHYLHQLGFQVTGADLAPHSIAEANKEAEPGLKYLVHDIRQPFPEQDFDAVFNLFTSLGYFDDEREDEAAIATLSGAARSGGYIVIDFMNTPKIAAGLVKHHELTLDGIPFIIDKVLKDGFFVKDIQFTDKGKSYHFTERVKAITKEQLTAWTHLANLKIIGIFGNYSLDEYQKEKSDRMIFILQKP